MVCFPYECMRAGGLVRMNQQLNQYVVIRDYVATHHLLQLVLSTICINLLQCDKPGC